LQAFVLVLAVVGRLVVARNFTLGGHFALIAARSSPLVMR